MKTSGSPIPHTKAVANGRYLAGLLTWNGLVKSEGLATPVFFFNTNSSALNCLFTAFYHFLSVDVSNVPLYAVELPVDLGLFLRFIDVCISIWFLLSQIL